MFLQIAGSKERLPSVTAIWLFLVLAGVVWVLWVGNRHGVDVIVQSVWVSEHRELVRILWDTNYFLFPFYAAFLALLIYAWYMRSRRWLAVVASYLLAQLVCGVIVVRLLKVLTGEARPRTLEGTGLDSQWIGPTLQHGYHSFPSGHSADAFISAFFLALLLPRPWMRVAVFAYAAFNAMTRLAVSRHFPVDIIVGALLGGFAALLTVRYVLLPWLSRVRS